MFHVYHCCALFSLWSPAEIGLATWLSCALCCFLCVFVTFPYDVPGQIWYFIVLIPDLRFSLYFYKNSR